MNFKLKELTLLPNLLSLIRLLLVIPVIYLLVSDFSGNREAVIILILIMYITDISDGYIARRFNQVSETGKIIDPIADKIVVALIFIVLYILGYVPIWFFLIVIIRDLLILLFGAYAKRKYKVTLTSNIQGKVAVFSIGLVILLTVIDYNYFLSYLRFLYYIVTFLILYSGWLYLLAFKNTLTKENS